MIINTRKDLDAAPDDVREQFLNRLASTINKHVWDGSEWVLQQDETSIARFGFTAVDFPDAPVPEVPDYNPDDRALEQEASEVRSQRDALLAETDWNSTNALDRVDVIDGYSQWFVDGLRRKLNSVQGLKKADSFVPWSQVRSLFFEVSSG